MKVKKGQPTGAEFVEESFEESSAQEKQVEEESKRVLRAIESLISPNDKIIEVCERCKAEVEKKYATESLTGRGLYKKTARCIVKHYADKSALSGGISGIPAFIPGIGSLVGFVGATAADVVLTLKYEIEMTLCLCHLVGFDISQERDRQLAFTLASVSSYDVRASKSVIVDTVALTGAAFWDYSMRQLSKYLLSMIGKILIMTTAKSISRAIPFVGVIVGLSVNKVLTTRTGNYCITALWQRRPIKNRENTDEVFEARFVDSRQNKEEA